MPHQDWKAALLEASRLALERRTDDINARTMDSMAERDDDEDYDTLDFGQLIKNVDHTS